MNHGTEIPILNSPYIYNNDANATKVIFSKWLHKKCVPSMKYGYPALFFKIAFKAVKSLHCEMTLQ